MTLGTRYLASEIAAFREQHPQLGFDLRLSDHITDLYNSDLDLAVRADSRLISQRLTENRRILVAPAGYIRQMGAPTHPRELVRYQCLLFAYPGL